MNDTLWAVLGGCAGGVVAFGLWLWAIEHQLNKHRVRVTVDQ